MKRSTASAVVPKTRRQWAKRLGDAWREAAGDMLAGIFKIGRDLLEAKAALEHGEFIAMIENDLPFSRHAAQRLMAIARDQRLTKGEHVRLLPPSWGTLYQLSRLNDETFTRLLKDGTIRPEMERSEVNKVLRLDKVAADEKRILNLKPVVGKFRTIVIDPAWEYDWLSIAGRAKPGYAMQTHEQLLALDVRAWADEEQGCHLYCWVTNNFMARACELIAHWGFQHRTVLTWIKPPPFGLGSYFRNSTEHVLFATLGKTTTRHAAASIPTHFKAPRGEHSEKPQEFYEIVRAASYPPFGEANQREPRQDFASLFCQVTEKKQVAAE